MVTIDGLNREQEQLCKQWIAEDDVTLIQAQNDVQGMSYPGVTYVGGVDISFCKNDPHTSVAGLVILTYPTLKVCP